MRQIIIGGFVCMVLVTTWQWASMSFMPWHQGIRQRISEERQVVDFIKQRTGLPGVYIFPAPPRPLEGRPTPEQLTNYEEALSAYANQRRGGAVGMLFYHPAGVQTNISSSLQHALAVNMLTAAAAGIILYMSLGLARRYWQRAGVVVMLSAFGGLAAYGPMFIWHEFPRAYVLALGWDLLLGWLIAGLVLAAIITPETEHIPEVIDADQGGYTGPNRTETTT